MRTRHWFRIGSFAVALHARNVAIPMKSWEKTITNSMKWKVQEKNRQFKARVQEPVVCSKMRRNIVRAMTSLKLPPTLLIVAWQKRQRYRVTAIEVLKNADFLEKKIGFLFFSPKNNHANNPTRDFRRDSDRIICMILGETLSETFFYAGTQNLSLKRAMSLYY